MSLYNVLFGQSPYCLPLLSMLGLKQEDCGRFRDAYPTENSIVLFTRLGGSNRVGTFERFVKRLQSHPLFLRDWDHPEDSTYAYYEFKIPDGMVGAVRHLVEQARENLPEVLIPPGERMTELQARKQRGEPTPEIDRAAHIMEPLMRRVNVATKTYGVVAILDGENGEPEQIIANGKRLE